MSKSPRGVDALLATARHGVDRYTPHQTQAAPDRGALVVDTRTERRSRGRLLRPEGGDRLPLGAGGGEPARLGLHRATDMIGGVEAWLVAGLPVTSGPADVRR